MDAPAPHRPFDGMRAVLSADGLASQRTRLQTRDTSSAAPSLHLDSQKEVAEYVNSSAIQLFFFWTSFWPASHVNLNISRMCDVVHPSPHVDLVDVTPTLLVCLRCQYHSFDSGTNESVSAPTSSVGATSCTSTRSRQHSCVSVPRTLACSYARTSDAKQGSLRNRRTQTQTIPATLLCTAISSRGSRQPCLVSLPAHVFLSQGGFVASMS